MKISSNWLSDYVAHGLSADDLAGQLTMAGLEVEGVEHIGGTLDGVVVGHVLDVKPHPNADRLTICRVDVAGPEPLQIICGAPNVAAGQRVPVATTGTTLRLPKKGAPGEREPVEISRTKLRGEVSEGMICAEDELGLSDDHSGIMVLDDEAVVGRHLAEHFAEEGIVAQDDVLDIAITPNRPDATSHIGVARDVAALTGLIMLRPEVNLPSSGGEAAEAFEVVISDPAACPRYVGMLVTDVEIGESPLWLKKRLEAVGLRPRNNVVDVTNYVMYECGQPLHAFDFDHLAGSRIEVRLTKQEQRFVTLDDEERTLPEGTLMICDGEREVAVAGVMGGANSEVTRETTNILIESAYFEPGVIRRAASALGLQTDSSYRFERGVDRNGQVWAAARAAVLIAELAGGHIVPGMVDAHPQPLKRRHITVRPSRVEALLGHRIPSDEIDDLLTAIGFVVEEEDPVEVLAEQALEGRDPAVAAVQPLPLRCTVPTFRPDIEREVDVIEEVARLYGYDKIPEPARTTIPTMVPEESPGDVLKRRARMTLVGLGYHDIHTNSMLPYDAATFFAEAMVVEAEARGAVETMNPISKEMAALRPSLLPGALSVMAFNQNHGRRVLRFAEFGHVFHRTERRDTLVPGYAEHDALLMALSGPRVAAGWDAEEESTDVFDLKGHVTTLLETLRLPDVSMKPSMEPTPVSDYHLALYSGGRHVGRIMKISRELAARYDLKQETFVAEMNWGEISELAAPFMKRRYQPVSRHPVVERDLAVIVGDEVPSGSMVDSVRAAGRPLLQDVGVFDLYTGENVGSGRKSIAFSLTFGAHRTLTEQEIEEGVQKVVKALEEEFGATLRG